VTLTGTNLKLDFTTSTALAFGPTVANIYDSTSSLGFELTANVFDNSGAGYMIGHRTLTESVFLFTDSTRVNQGTGELLFSPDYSNAVALAGPAANPTTQFYENSGIAPLHVEVNGGNALFFNGGTKVYSVSLASLGATNDYFLMEAFLDAGHQVITLYGINAPGTLASGVYFSSQVFPNLSSFTSAAYIIHWQGANPNVPLPSDTFTQVYSS